MRLAYFALAFLPAVLASPFELVPRADNSALVLKDIKAEDSQGKTLNQTVNGISNSDGVTNAQITQLSGQTDKLNKAIQKTTKDSTQSSKFSQTGSKNIAEYVLNTLTPDVTSILDNIISKYPAFAKKNDQPLVKATLTNQLKLVKKQAAALTAKLADPYAGQAPAATKVIVDKYNEAIKKYSK